jgi:hypothetical protein
VSDCVYIFVPVLHCTQTVVAYIHDLTVLSAVCDCLLILCAYMHHQWQCIRVTVSASLSQSVSPIQNVTTYSSYIYYINFFSATKQHI